MKYQIMISGKNENSSNSSSAELAPRLVKVKFFGFFFVSVVPLVFSIMQVCFLLDVNKRMFKARKQ